MLAAVPDVVADLLAYIDRSPTPYHAVAETVRRLRAADFRELSETEVWELAPGDAVLFDFLTLHGAPGNTCPGRRRGFSTRWLGDDARYAVRQGTTSPPYPDIGLEDGERLREDWFPVVWRA